MFNGKTIAAAVLSSSLLTLAACERDAPDPQVSEESPDPAVASQTPETAPVPAADELTPLAVAVLHPTDGNEAQGNVVFSESESGVGANVNVNVTNVTPGPHGLHIHEFGDCGTPDASSAGGHFNPAGNAHGGRNAPESHLGDMGNVLASEGNLVDVEFYMENFVFSGPNSIAGKAVVLHAGEDDLTTDPDGAAGERIACGVVMLSSPTAPPQNIFESVP